MSGSYTNSIFQKMSKHWSSFLSHCKKRNILYNQNMLGEEKIYKCEEYGRMRCKLIRFREMTKLSAIFAPLMTTSAFEAFVLHAMTSATTP